VDIIFLKRHKYIGNPTLRKGGEGGFDNPGGGSGFQMERYWRILMQFWNRYGVGYDYYNLP